MYPTSNQPAQLYETAKTHKHENIDEINVQSLNFRPIIAQTGTCTYNAAQVISNYLKPLYTCNEYIIGNTQDFSKLIQEQSPLQLDEEYVSYDIESLFTNVPITETIEYILDEIYVKNKLPKLCSRLIFKRLLLKLTTESTYMFNSKFYKQSDGCTMGGPLSVTFSNIYLTKLEIDKVRPTKPLFYKRFVDDVINRRKENTPDLLLTSLDCYLPNINFTVEVNPSKFLDFNIEIVNGKVETSIYRKPNKILVHWTSKVPKRYKRNAVNGDLNRSYQISLNFDHEKEIIREKYDLPGFPTRFVDNVIHQFRQKLIDKQAEYELIIPDFLFAEPKKFILVEISYCVSNENTV